MMQTSLNKYAPFDTKQVDYLRKTFNCEFNVLEGGKRAGKNLLNIIAFANAIEDHPDKIHMIGAVTRAAARMNIVDSNGFGLEYYFAGRCYECKYKGMEALAIQTKTGKKYVIIAGGRDSDSYRAIKGNSYGCIYITEANECHETFVKEAMDRTLSSSRRRMFFDLNPKPPRHWFYREILDYQDELYDKGQNDIYNYCHLTIWNNLSISDERLDELLHGYKKSSLWYQVDVLGLRKASTGKIYTTYNRDTHAVTRKWIKEQEFVDFSVGVDVGGVDASVMTYTGYTKDRLCVLMDGYYHKQGKEDIYTHARYATEMVDKHAIMTKHFPRLATATFYVESADKLFRRALKIELDKRGFTGNSVVPSYKNDGIVDRIRLHSILFSEDRLFISKHMDEWHEAYENATWDDKKYEDGEWVRVDDGSYPVDCLDASEYSTIPFKEYLLGGEL